MPMSRYQIRNEYSLADPELYRAADKDDPEALLEGVAMAGLVGVLRQLGDLAEFAAEIFHDLHEEVMATATRGHGLMVRVQQLEAEFPSIEKAFLSQTSHSTFFSNSGTDWHPSLHTNQNLVTRGDLPRFVMDSYEECRGPPRLFLLDKFDVAGAGACLKRYTDPSFFKVEASSYGLTSAEIQREKKSRKAKKKSSRWRNRGTPEVLPTSHAKLHQLFLEERVQNGVSDPARLVKLKRRLNGFPLDTKTGKSYMEKFISTSLPEDKVVHEISYGSLSLELPSKITSDSGFELLETSAVSSVKESVHRKSSPFSSPSVEKTVLGPSMDEVREDVSDWELSSGPKQYPHSDTSIISPTLHEVVDEKEIAIDGEHNADDYLSDDIASEVDNYMDALATMDSEIETDTEFRPKNEPGFVNIEKQGTDSNANEEQLQAQYSDSQSVGNSTASDDGNSSSKKGISSFSYSDTGSISAENMPADVDVSANDLPSTEICKAEITDVSIEKVSTSEEITVSQPPKHEGSLNTCTEVAEIPSYGSEFGEHSPSSCLTDSIPTHFPVDQGEILAGGAFSGPELLEISSNLDELDKQILMTGQHETNEDVNLPYTSKDSDLPSQTRHDVPPTDGVSAENHLVDKLDDEENTLSNASIHFSNTLNVAPKEYICESSLDNVLQTEHAEDSCTKNLVSGRISLPHSVTSHAEDESFVPVLLEFETCNTDLQPEVIDSVDDPSAREITVNTTIALDNSDNPYFTEQQGSEQTDDIPPLKTGSAEVGICYGEKSLDGVLSKADGEEIGGITPSMNLIGSEDTVREISSVSSNSTGPGSLTDFPVHLDENETEISQSENIIVTAFVASHASDADEVDVDCSSERNSQAEYLDNIQELVQNEFEVYGDRLSPSHNESNKQKEICNEEIASPNSDSVRCEAVFCDHSESELVNYVPDSSLAAEAESRLHEVEAIMVLSSSKYSGQHSESVSSGKSNLIENTDDALPSPTPYDSEARIPFEQKLVMQADLLDIGQLHADETKSKEISQSEQVQSLDHMDEGSIDAHSEPFLVANEPGVQVDIQAGCLDVKSLHGDETSVESSSQLEQMQFTNHTDHERVINASPKSFPIEGSESELSEPGSHKVNISEQARDPISSVPPSFSLLPEVPQINLEEMPPLPPLPPVQWRIGRPQHSSPTPDRDADQNTVDLFPPMFPSKANNNSQMGYPALHMDGLLPPAPVLPSTAVKDEDYEHIYEHVANNMVHSSPLSIQMPTMSNDRNMQEDFLTSGSTPNMIPYLTLPSTCNERPQHDFQAGEVGSMQPNSSPFLAVRASGDEAYTFASRSPHEVSSHPLHHLQQELSLENEKPEGTSVSSEVRMINPSVANSAQPTVVDEQPKYVSTTSEGELVWTTSTSSFPAVEDGLLDGNRPTKLPRPRSPLIDAVAAHDKSKLRKVTERVRPEIQKVEERDTLLEQIRAKSFNLKPAVVTRPSFQGPQTNLRVAAILEKANAIRQALAGSDEDDDDDSWSDS